VSGDERPDINAVLEHYGSSTKDRRSYMTNCVFHEDRTPSLSVNTEIHVWNCMSCSKSGDSYTLIMLKEETDFRGAREIAKQLGLEHGTGETPAAVGSSYGGTRRASARAPSRKASGGYRPRWRRDS
jgi:DNA primase